MVIEETKHLEKPSNDNRIISTAFALAISNDNKQPVILVSKDTSVRIKADSLGLETQDYLKDKVVEFCATHDIADKPTVIFGEGSGQLRFDTSYMKQARLWEMNHGKQQPGSSKEEWHLLVPSEDKRAA